MTEAERPSADYIRELVASAKEESRSLKEESRSLAFYGDNGAADTIDALCDAVESLLEDRELLCESVAQLRVRLGVAGNVPRSWILQELDSILDDARQAKEGDSGLKRKPPPVQPKTIPYWPYCEECETPYDFDEEEPFAYCNCGTSEWSYPRPAPYVKHPNL